MSIGFVNESSTNGIGLIVTITKPTNVVEGHLMIAHIQMQDKVNNGLSSTPSNWNLLIRKDDGDATYNNYEAIFYKIATASETSSYSWEFSGSSQPLAGRIIAYSGCDTSNTFHAYSATNDTTFNTSSVATSINVSASNCWVLTTLGWEGAANYSSGPGSYTKRSYGLESPVFADSNGYVTTGLNSPGIWNLTLGKNKSMFTMALNEESKTGWKKILIKARMYRR